MSADASRAADADAEGTPAPELTPEEWAPLKAVWEQGVLLPADERSALLAAADLSTAARRVLGELLALDDSAGERLERPAHERLGLISPVQADALALPSMVGRRLGPYQVLQLVGRGGMGAVYEAERADLAYKQRVAIKTLWRGADSDVLLQRFRSERQILAALQHPNIAQLLDGGSTDEGTPWLAMEFVDGTPIDAWCDARALDIPARLELFPLGVRGGAARASAPGGASRSQAFALLDQGAAADQSSRLQVYNTYIDDALARGDTAAARRVARRSVRELAPSGAPMIMGFAQWALARAELAARDASAALRAIEVGQQWIDRAPDLESVHPLLRRVQLEALTQLGRVAEADSVRRSVTPRSAIPPCTPGGDWKGCPDLPP